MRALLLGIDIGTSACKVAVFDKTGNVVASGSGEYKVYYPKPGWAEQDPNDWWEAVCKVLKDIIYKGEVKPQEIVGIGIDGQSWAAIPMSKNGKVLCNTPIWMDTRSDEICKRMQKEIGENEIFSLTGNLLQPSYTTGKVLWFKEKMPEMYGEIHKILQVNSFLVYKFSGVYSHDKSQGYGFHCFNMKTGEWDIDMCEKLGISPEFLPDIYECSQIVGRVTKHAAAESGLVEGIPVVAGGLDAACGTLGAGVIHAGETQEQGGQAGGMSVCLDEYKADKRLILGYHVIPNCWLLQGGTTGGGGVMRWFEREFADYERTMEEATKKSSLEQLNVLAGEVNPGSDGVVFLPYMSGERSPVWNPNAKGVFYGLDFSKTKGHMVRACMEGVAYSLKHNLEVSEESGANVKELSAIGGSANSVLWTQIKADITGKPIVVPSSDTATTLGAALLAGVGIGMYKDFDEAVQKTVKVTRRHEPNVMNKGTYDANYEIYKLLYQQLEGIMSQKNE